MSLDVLQVSGFVAVFTQCSQLSSYIKQLSQVIILQQKSRVGLSVNKLRQKYSKSEVASVAKKLIKSWKKLLPGMCCSQLHVLCLHHEIIIAGQNSSREHTPKSKSGSSSPKSTAATTISSEKPVTPPPVMYTKQLSNSSQDNGEGSVKNGDIPMRRLSSTTSDDVILNFPLSVDSFSRAASTGSDVRDRCRGLLSKALMKGFDEGGFSSYQWHFTVMILYHATGLQ